MTLLSAIASASHAPTVHVSIATAIGQAIVCAIADTGADIYAAGPELFEFIKYAPDNL